MNKMHAQVAHQMAKQGMDKSAFVLLATLSGLGECRSSALAEAVLSDPSTVSRQVAGLVKDGLDRATCRSRGRPGQRSRGHRRRVAS